MERESYLQMWGIDHRNAPTEVREKVHIDPGKVKLMLKYLEEQEGFISAIPISTCNRTEIYLEASEGFQTRDALLQALTHAGIDGSLFEKEFASHKSDLEAVRHIYRVTSGLESMMLGESQIGGQVKDAYRLAKEYHKLGPIMMRTFQCAFRACKQVRSQTEISTGAISVAFAAVELARKFFDNLAENRALLVGAGETGSLAARHFLQHGIGWLTVINRSPEKAKALAEELNDGNGGLVRTRPWEELAAALADVDVVLTTTGALEPIILPGMVRSALPHRKGKPLFILDIAVPRDVHDDVAGLRGVYLFGLGDLEEIVQFNLAARRKELPKADKIIEKELETFQEWIKDMGMRPTVTEFRAFLEELREKEVNRVRKKVSEETASAVENSLQTFIKTLMRKPVVRLKSAGSQEERSQDINSLRRLFELDDEEEDSL
ncbi:MAG: glutamyl-tRNA reductase [Candidatus Eisenbacteria bacterium]|uniref:Glutamyl-tRNA reductase n=1 Tax=Eiseniibacteriota bacterium TaxID=2212470 RepID=A0A948W6U4_UNCEI|nr:glutamyl-tRNA reductase [Candidatus Eisenbacteria bacterium]MBU2691495.1 glutamyl-tRNA reductase [Candidatus Eisenbacteria bacterium]